MIPQLISIKAVLHPFKAVDKQSVAVHTFKCKVVETFVFIVWKIGLNKEDKY